MKNILVLNLVILLMIVSCTGCSHYISTSESVECQRFKVLFNNLAKENIKTLVFYSEDGNEPVDEAAFEEVKEGIFNLAGCCFCEPYFSAPEWTVCNRLECIREHLENESIKKIAFYDKFMDAYTRKTEPPEDWGKPYAELTEPQKIEKVLKLIYKAMKKEKDKFANEDVIFSVQRQMQIVTNKHKFIISISDYEGAIRGIGWTSYELRKKLTRWGFPEAE